MLAYVFWHRPADPAAADAYESALAAFHAALAAHPPEGFEGSVAYRVGAAPWLPGPYEDWYRVRDWAALGRLNDAAVEGPRAEPHDAVALAAAAGAGGVYRLLAGEPRPPAGPHAHWLSKPRGTDYAAFDAALTGHGSVWRRQMVLGPAPEYVLLAAEPVALDFPAEVVRAREVAG